MTNDTNLRFIREKIYEIRSAVMYSMSNGLIRVPNNIVHVIKVDDEGMLWFLCPPPSHKLEECECVFPARLLFYRKGKYFHLEVSGKATIINNEYDGLSNTGSEESRGKSLLIKMNMINVEYSAANEKREKGKWEYFLENGYKWVMKNLALPREEKSVFSKLHQTH